MTYKEIRSKYQNRWFVGVTIVDLYATLISPVFTKIFLRLGFIPNTITVFMIISGLIGGGLFLVDNIFIKMVGLVFIHLWYIFDCSDGEVARINKKFSKFGKELDYTAHIVNHPLYNIAFAMSLISLNRYESLKVIILFMVLLAVDLIGRNLVSLNQIFDQKMSDGASSSQDEENVSKKKRYIMSMIHFFDCYPNFALIFPITFVIDYFFKTNISIIYLYVQVTIVTLIIIRLVIKWVRKIKNL